jgi:hypothetical protein
MKILDLSNGCLFESPRGYLCYSDEAKSAIKKLEEENNKLSDRIGQFEASRIAYANEFQPNEDGEPDVGNIHANIRKLKAERDELKLRIESLEKSGECDTCFYASDDGHEQCETCSPTTNHYKPRTFLDKA